MHQPHPLSLFVQYLPAPPRQNWFCNGDCKMMWNYTQLNINLSDLIAEDKWVVWLMKLQCHAMTEYTKMWVLFESFSPVEAAPTYIIKSRKKLWQGTTEISIIVQCMNYWLLSSHLSNVFNLWLQFSDLLHLLTVKCFGSHHRMSLRLNVTCSWLQV